MKAPDPLDLVCYHVGGYGDYSHANILGETFPTRTLYVAFEARLDDSDVDAQQKYVESGIRTLLIQECVSDRNGIEKFYVNTRPASSSLFRPSPKAFFEHMPGDAKDVTWKTNTELDRVVEIQTTTIDDVIARRAVPAPDMLSVDAQGAELKIFHGAQRAFEHNILAVISEVEFHRIYEGQPLFSDQFEFLYSHGFRLAEIFAQQYWHPVARAGYGLLTVGEALFIRDARELLALPGIPAEQLAVKLIKLAALAFLFGRLSIVVHTLNLAVDRFGKGIIERIEATPEYAVLLNVYDYVNEHLGQYAEDPSFFENSDFLTSKYGAVAELGRRGVMRMPTYPYVRRR